MLCVFLFIAAGIAVVCATGIGEREHSARYDLHDYQSLQQDRAMGN